MRFRADEEELLKRAEKQEKRIRAEEYKGIQTREQVLAPIQEERKRRLSELEEEQKKAGLGKGTEFGKGGVFDLTAEGFQQNADIIANAMESQEKARAELTNITNKLLADMLDTMRNDEDVKKQTDEIRKLSDDGTNRQEVATRVSLLNYHSGGQGIRTLNRSPGN